ncbi:MAG TPA: ATP-binding cassette domain-containing protein [Sedimentisphaerales bacterium]|nr:ATP-binding cassette domain-containing protein [Sedimentisphaerales bacterium]
MPTYNVSRSFGWDGQITEKAAAVMRMFGLTVERLKAGAVRHECVIEIEQGDIVYITGPSGAGKSVLLNELEECVPASEKVNLDEIELPADKTVIECIEGDVLKGLKVLSAAGLSDVTCILNKASNLSDGQKYRFRLAKAMASGKKFVFADEFCCGLDRITAAVIAYNVHRFAKRAGVTFILAAGHEDTLIDLAPDVLVVKELSGPAQVIYKQKSR